MEVKNETEFLIFLRSHIREIVQEEMKKLRFVRSYPAKVHSLNSSLVNVKMAGEEDVIYNLKNKTGQTLSIGDNVLLFSPTNNLTNLFVAYKF